MPLPITWTRSANDAASWSVLGVNQKRVWPACVRDGWSAGSDGSEAQVLAAASTLGRLQLSRRRARWRRAASDVTLHLAENRMEVHRNTAEPWRVTLIDTGEKIRHQRARFFRLGIL